MSKRDTKRAKAGVGKRLPAIECPRCKEWYSPSGPRADIHKRKVCLIKK